MRDASNSNSTTHYFGYRLVDDEGKPITASGIKLMSNPALPSPTDQQLQEQLHANQQLDFQHDLDSSDSEEPAMTPTPDAVNAVAHELDELLHSKEPAASSVPVATQQAQQTRQKPKPSKPRLKDLAVNLTDLMAAAENLGLPRSKGKGQSYQALLQQLLHNLASAESDFSAPSQSADSPVGGEALAQSIATLSQEMVSLRQQLSDITAQLHTTQQQLSQAQDERESRRLLAAEVHSLRQQLEQAQADRTTLQAQLDQLTPLQAQHDQLKAELEKAQEILNQFRRLSMGNEPIQVVSVGTEPLQVTPVSTSKPSATAAPTPSTAPTISPASQSATPVPTTPPIGDAAVNVASATNQAAKRGTRSYRLAPGKLSPQERIFRAIQALIHHNQSCTDPSDRWFVTRQLIADMSGTNNQTYVKPIFDHPSDLFPGFETVAAAIHHHNQDMGLPNPQHNKGKEKEELQSIYQSFDPNQAPTA